MKKQNKYKQCKNYRHNDPLGSYTGVTDDKNIPRYKMLTTYKQTKKTGYFLIKSQSFLLN